jgi:hypothetical protein
MISDRASELITNSMLRLASESDHAVAWEIIKSAI